VIRLQPFWNITLKYIKVSTPSPLFAHIVDTSIAADGDDIIKAMTALHLLGRSYKIMDMTGAAGHNFTSNCGLLLGFVHSPKPALYNDQITKCVQLICDEWWVSDTPFLDDKVNKL
jgi:hypothetical protein